MKKIIVITRSNEYRNWSCADGYENVTIGYNHVNLFYSLLELRIKVMNDIEIEMFNENIKPVGFSDLTAIDLDDDESIYDYLNILNPDAVSLFEKYYAKEAKNIQLYNSYVSTVLDTEVVFVYWDNIPVYESIAGVSENKIELVDAIVKDCSVDQNKINQLYIHDKEWGGVTRDAIIIKDGSVVEKDYIKDYEFEKLKKTFSHVVTFRHTGTAMNATIFDKIRLFDFNMGSAVTVKCAEADKACKSDFKDAFNKLSKVQ